MFWYWGFIHFFYCTDVSLDAYPDSTSNFNIWRLSPFYTVVSCEFLPRVMKLKHPLFYSNYGCICSYAPSYCAVVMFYVRVYRPWRPLGLREVEAPTFSDIPLIDGGNVVSPTRWPLLPPGRFLVLISVRSWVDPRAIVRLEGLGKVKKSTSTGTRTGDLPPCSTVPQPTTLPRTPCFIIFPGISVAEFPQICLKTRQDKICLAPCAIPLQ
jgi:hypothetical protein